MRPNPPESSLFHGGVGLELDDHEVGSRNEELVGEVLPAGERGERGGGVLGPAAAQDLHGVEVPLGVELGELKDHVVADGAFQRPLAVQVRPVLLRVIGALDGLAGGLRVEVALAGTVHLVGHVAAVVLAVALERLRGRGRERNPFNL